MVETDWGYSVETLPSLISVQQLRELYSLSSTDAQLQTVLDAVSSAIRDFCGWHVAPSLSCTFKGHGDGRLLMLPAMGVTAGSSLKVGGTPVTAYEWTSAGMVRLTDGAFPDAWRSVECTYVAGFSAQSVGQVAAQVAANALVAAPGVSAERAGDVSITYNQTGVGITGGVSLLQRDRDALAPYRLARAW